MTASMAKVKSLQNAGNAYLTGFDFHAKAHIADHITATTSLVIRLGSRPRSRPADASRAAALWPHERHLRSKQMDRRTLRALQHVERSAGHPPFRRRSLNLHSRRRPLVVDAKSARQRPSRRTPRGRRSLRKYSRLALPPLRLRRKRPRQKPDRKPARGFVAV
jgi:hypothetical protein